MKISTSIHMFDTDYPMEQAIQRCKAAGFEALDFNYTDYMPQLLRKSWPEEERWAHNIREAAESWDAVFTQMHGPIHGASFDNMQLGLDLDTYIAYSERSLRTAAILGIPWVVLHPGNLTLQGGEPTQSQLVFNRNAYLRLLPVMEKTGVGVTLENMFDRPRGGGRSLRSYCATAEELAELVRSLNHPLFGACWDTGHAHIQGVDQSSSLRILGSLLKAVHIQDNQGVSDSHLLPYQGSIDWVDVMSGMAAAGYQGDFTYETHGYFRPVPLELMDSALSFAVSTAKHLTKLFHLEPAAIK
ncbi:sugar phosphate isomerase/epimerase [Paenibacillus glycanilyticus]|uniref:sugar phosphate isomerase/epimerase family protein n=1 Tax=Paenibacillus glycanilyticus TaxID=126569 RepID=UPI0020418004|nr:sugar phosphate isomerase/epimerase family protein [Paenibacillus glycanilyticus]MCM3626269.1 sugar phosphate isomerase/epimerase [Paenibacillus glycanilyticus]